MLQVLERALQSANSQFNTDASNPTVGFLRLSGALHCEERSAFQEIAHQLCRYATGEVAVPGQLSEAHGIKCDVQRRWFTRHTSMSAVRFLLDLLCKAARPPAVQVCCTVQMLLQHTQHAWSSQTPWPDSINILFGV